MTRRASFPFRLKLTLAGGLLALVPLSVVGWLLLDVNADAVRTHAREHDLAVTDDVARTVATSFVAAQDHLDAIGRVLVDPTLASDATLELATALVSGAEEIDHVAVYDAQGAIIDVIKEQGARANVPETLPVAWRQEADTHRVATGPVEREGASAPRAPVLVPLRVEGQTSGYALTMLSLAPLQERIERLGEVRFQRASASELFVVDERGRVLASAEPSAVFSDASADPALEGLELGTLGGRLQQSGEHVREGRTFVGSVVGMDARPWAVVVRRPEEVVYASLHRMRRIVIGTLLAVLALALIVAFLVAKQITRPIDALSSFAKDLAARRFDRRVTIQTRDELGVLGDVMSTAAADLEASEARIAEEVAIRTDLGRYLPAEVVDAVVRREQDMGLGGKRRTITVLFADVVAFTPLTDRLSAEEVVALLNELFTILTEIVFRHGGTIDKFVGDCVMALWGAPIAQEDHAARALAAAEDMMRWLEAGNAGWEAKYGVTIQLAIGVHSGEAVVGNVGSETRMEFTAIGDTVNVAARLEAIARPMQVLVTSETRQAAGPEQFDFVDLGERALSGRAAEVHLWELRT
ncbi:MAG: adenylate/guanylate cyclase domain-containing protein [Polyangiales bacterium]